MLISPYFCFFYVVAPVVLIVPFLAGCAQTVKNVASTAGAAAGRAAAPALVDQLDQLNQPDNQNKILAFSRSPAMQGVAHDVGNGVGEGITDEFVTIATGNTSMQPTASTPAVSAAQARVLVRQDLDPIVTDIVRTAVGEAIHDATSHDAQMQASAMSEAIAQSAARGVMREFQQEGSTGIGQMIRQEIAPAIGDAIRQQFAQTLNESSQSEFKSAFHHMLYEEVVPAVRQMWDQGATDTLLLPTRKDLAPAVRDSAHNLAFGTATGTHAALIQLGVLSQSGDLTGAARTFAWGAGIVLVLVGLAAGAMLVVLAMIAIALWRRPLGVK